MPPPTYILPWNHYLAENENYLPHTKAFCLFCIETYLFRGSREGAEQETELTTSSKAEGEEGEGGGLKMEKERGSTIKSTVPWSSC